MPHFSTAARLTAALLLLPVALPLAYPASFLADGVDLDDLAGEGSRFYDAGKGWNWIRYNDTLQEVWDADGSWERLGDLAGYATRPASQWVPGGYGNLYKLRQDENKCWAYTSSNVLQYWQDTYGQFYRGASPLPTGLTYSRENLVKFGGIQSTAISLLFYDNTNNIGGDSSFAFEWYLRGHFTHNTNGDQVFTNATSEGGYFSDYFNPDGSWSFGYESAARTDLQAWAESFAKALGCSLGEDGQYHTVTEGQIAYVSLIGDTGQHAVTCYGFETDGNGALSAIYCADSDNEDGFALDKFYVGADALLYTDEACTQAFGSYYLNSLAYINTPDSLKRLLAGSRADVLLWGEGSGTWSPDILGEGHWETEAGAAAEFMKSKDVRFTEASADRTIKVDADVTAGSVTVVTVLGRTDTFSPAAEGGAVLHATEYVKEGSGQNRVEVQLDTKQVSVAGGELVLAGQGSGAWELTSLQLAAGTTLSVIIGGGSATDGGEHGALVLGKEANMEVGKGAVLKADLSLSGATLSLEDTLTMASASLTLGGDNTLLWRARALPNDVVLATGVTSLTLITGEETRTYQLGEVWDAAEGMDASLFFSNLEGSDYRLYYNNLNGGTVGMLSVPTPEPSAAFLSLMGLAGLALHRRRKAAL